MWTQCFIFESYVIFMKIGSEEISLEIFHVRSSLEGNLFLNGLSFITPKSIKKCTRQLYFALKIIELLVIINSWVAPMKVSVHGQSENVCPSIGLA